MPTDHSILANIVQSDNTGDSTAATAPTLNDHNTTVLSVTYAFNASHPTSAPFSPCADPADPAISSHTINNRKYIIIDPAARANLLSAVAANAPETAHPTLLTQHVALSHANIPPRSCLLPRASLPVLSF